MDAETYHVKMDVKYVQSSALFDFKRQELNGKIENYIRQIRFTTLKFCVCYDNDNDM